MNTPRLIVTCRSCKQEFEPDQMDLIRGKWRTCKQCRESHGWSQAPRIDGERRKKADMTKCSSSKTWKDAERNVAALLGGRRVPVSGRSRGDAPDIEHERFSIEVKHRNKLPAWLLDALDQAEKAAHDGQLPIVVLHQKQTKYTDSLVVLRLAAL